MGISDTKIKNIAGIWHKEYVMCNIYEVDV